MIIVNDERAEQAIQRIATEIGKVDRTAQETAEQVEELTETVDGIGTATLIIGNQYRLGL